MYNSIRTVLAVIIMLPSTLHAEQADTVNCLKVSGKAFINGKIAEDVTVRLFKDNAEIEQDYLQGKHNRFSFTLKSFGHYTVKIYKEGFEERAVSFDTFLPEGVAAEPLYHFDFELEMVPDAKTPNDYSDYPIAIIKYCSEKDVFDYSKKYTDIIKTKLSTYRKPDVFSMN